jgi:hypothetical protein
MMKLLASRLFDQHLGAFGYLAGVQHVARYHHGHGLA